MKYSLEEILQLVEHELARAQSKFGDFNSTHEGYAVLLEELDEMWDEIKHNDTPRSVEEAFQVAAMAVRYILNFGEST